MKKLLVIVVLGLMWCNISFAETVILRCEGVSIKKMEKGELNHKPLNYYSIFQINLDENYYLRDEGEEKTFFIKTEDKLMWYSLFPRFGGGFYISQSKLSRVTGEWRYKSISELSAYEYKIIKKKLDRINKSIKNYKPNIDWGDEGYAVRENTPKEKELEKFKIIEKEIEKASLNSDHLEGYWKCKQQQKAF